MQKIITKRKNGTIRVQHKPIGVSKTDQSFKKSSDINQIIAHYQKTGILPQGKQGAYLDISNLPTFMEAHAIVDAAKEMFLTLPSDIRKAMDNDPANLESFINNPKNADKLIEHGLLHPKFKEAEKASQEAKEQVLQDKSVE